LREHGGAGAAMIVEVPGNDKLLFGAC